MMREIPLGAHSPQLDAVRALRLKAGRREHGRFAVEGPTMLEEALRSGLTPEAIYATAEAAPAVTARADAPDCPLYVVPDRALGRLSDVATPHHGLIAVFPLRLTDLEELLASGKPLALLSGVADPGNAGTLLRSAEIFGFGGTIFAGPAVEPHNPKVVRASMGAIFRHPIAVAERLGLYARARTAGYRVIATGPGGSPLPGYRFSLRSILAIGNERRGVGEGLDGWHDTVAIPQSGPGESLNAAVAGSIVFYAFATDRTSLTA
jgi:TrmH family RNA methyltransferase